MSSLEQAFNLVARDSTSGSLGLVDQLCTAIAKSRAATLSAREKDALRNFSSSKKQFAVVSHFVAYLLKYTGQDVRSAVDDYRLVWEETANQLLQKGNSRMELFTKFLVHSHSETIVRYFKLASSTKQGIKIWQTVSLPENEGEVQAQRLMEMGLNVQLIPDDPGQNVFQEIEAFLCGADAISSNSFINKTGTKLLATNAQKARKNVFVLADPRKRIADVSQYQSIIASMDPLFEEIPSALVTEFIDEL